MVNTPSIFMVAQHSTGDPSLMNITVDRMIKFDSSPYSGLDCLLSTWKIFGFIMAQPKLVKPPWTKV